jgi:hypothetical protein
MDPKNISDRRKLKRKKLAYYMLVVDVQTQQTIGHLVDITPIGLAIDSQKPISLEKDFRLLLELTPDISNKSQITFSARTKWCRRDEIEPSLYDIGFSITGITPGDAAIIQRLSDKYAARDSYSFPLR